MTFKETALDEQAVEAFARVRFSGAKLESLPDGGNSLAWILRHRGESTVIRVGEQALPYLKDGIIHPYCETVDVSSPSIHEIDTIIDSGYFCISDYVEGTVLASSKSHLKDSEVRKDYLNTLTRIHSINAVDDINANDAAFISGGFTWKEYLEGFYQQDFKLGIIAEQIAEGHLEPALLLRMEKSTVKLLDRCVDIYDASHLIHGDYQPHNVIVGRDSELTVIDWGNAKIGDFAYDLVWSSMHPPHLFELDEFLEHYKESGFDMTNIRERVILYEMSILLSWAIWSNEKGNYQEAKNNQKRLAKLLDSYDKL